MKKVCRFIRKIRKQMGKVFTFLALIKKYRAPKKALARSINAGINDDVICSSFLVAYGSKIINEQPIRAKNTPNHSILIGITPIK